jgi:hypothetical protein
VSAPDGLIKVLRPKTRGKRLDMRFLLEPLEQAELTRIHCAGSRSSTEVTEQVDDDTTVVEPDQGNGSSCISISLNNAPATGLATDIDPVLSHLIAQLRPGADLSRVTLPTFILEPRSMLERITKYDPKHGSLGFFC